MDITRDDSDLASSCGRLRALRGEFEQVLGRATQLRDGTQDLEAQLIRARIPPLEEPQDAEPDADEDRDVHENNGVFAWPPRADELAACEVIYLTDSVEAGLRIDALPWTETSIASADGWEPELVAHECPHIDTEDAPPPGLGDGHEVTVIEIPYDASALDTAFAASRQLTAPLIAVSPVASTLSSLVLPSWKGRRRRVPRERHFVRVALAFGLSCVVVTYVETLRTVSTNASWATGVRPRAFGRRDVRSAAMPGPATEPSRPPSTTAWGHDVSLPAKAAAVDASTTSRSVPPALEDAVPRRSRRPLNGAGVQAARSRLSERKAAGAGHRMSSGAPAASIAQRAPTGASVSPGRSSRRILAAASTEASSAAAVPAPRSSTLPLEPPPTSAGRPARSDDDRIRSTLSQFRTAYVQLNASAARAVWPSINEEALTRAFSDLRSQELRFDRCELDVNGSDARADCRGEATYIRRVGSQRPRTAQREWKFNLKKKDDDWTIASAQIR